MKTEILVPINFPDNDIIFGQDMQYWQNVPNDITFYPIECSGRNVAFMGDGYGIRPNNPFGLEGRYGNGCIYIEFTRLPTFIQEKVYPLFAPVIDEYQFKDECNSLIAEFMQLMKSNTKEAKELLNRLKEVKRSVATEAK